MYICTWTTKEKISSMHDCDMYNYFCFFLFCSSRFSNNIVVEDLDYCDRIVQVDGVILIEYVCLLKLEAHQLTDLSKAKPADFDSIN